MFFFASSWKARKCCLTKYFSTEAVKETKILRQVTIICYEAAEHSFTKENFADACFYILAYVSRVAYSRL